jgi:pantetheine-phosphate adenylyltransferase
MDEGQLPTRPRSSTDAADSVKAPVKIRASGPFSGGVAATVARSAAAAAHVARSNPRAIQGRLARAASAMSHTPSEATTSARPTSHPAPAATVPAAEPAATAAHSPSRGRAGLDEGIREGIAGKIAEEIALTGNRTNGMPEGCSPSAHDRYNPAPSMARAAHHALFPGSFDPVTLGHVDLVARALAIVDRVTVAVAVNPDKPGLFTAEERADLLRRSLQLLPAGLRERTAVELVPGLVVDAARDLGCDLIVRGVRSGHDFDYEAAMARTNRALRPAVETLLLVPAPELSHVSSTLVRQIALCGGDASAFVPAPVAEALRKRGSRRT